MTIKILVADDEELLRSGLSALLRSQPDMEVAGEAANGREAVEHGMALRPDVVLMDVRMPELDGIEATRMLAEASADKPIKVLILSTYDLDEYVFEALVAGARGFLLKDVPAEDLIEGIRIVAAGDALLAPTLTKRLIEEFTSRPESRRALDRQKLAHLTAREIEVLVLVGKGLSNSEIAERLFVSENTVKSHLRHLFDKLVLRDRVHAVIFAYEAGLMDEAMT